MQYVEKIKILLCEVYMFNIKIAEAYFLADLHCIRIHT